MNFCIILMISDKYVSLISEHFLKNYPNYTIDFLFSKDFPLMPDFKSIRDRSKATKNLDNIIPFPRKYIVLADTDAAISAVASLNYPLIAFSHKDNPDESLMGTPWLILDVEALDPDFLMEVYCRHYGIPMEIAQTNRCRIRELTMEDLDALRQLQLENVSNPSGCFFPSGYAKSFEEEKNFLYQYIRHQYPLYRFGIFAVIHKKTSVPIGIAGYSIAENGSAELSYSFLKKWQHRGYASEAVRKLISIGESNFHLEHVYVSIEKSNTPSLEFAKKMKLDIHRI